MWVRMLTRDRQAGFTLVELTISIAILGIVMSAIVAAMLLALKSTSETSAAIGETGDLQFASAFFANDVQGANTMASTGSPKCGTGTLVIEFAGPDFDPATLAAQTDIVSYVRITATDANGSPVTEVHRLSCSTTSPTPSYPLTPTGDVKVADQLSETSAPTAACANAAGAALACSNALAVKASLTLTSDSGSSYVLSGIRRTSP